MLHPKMLAESRGTRQVVVATCTPRAMLLNQPCFTKMRSMPALKRLNDAQLKVLVEGLMLRSVLPHAIRG